MEVNMENSATVSQQEIGWRLAQVREAAGLKQIELAQKVTWSAAVLSRVESGERELSSEELGVVLAAIDTPEARQLSTALERVWQMIQRPPLDHQDQDLLWESEQVCRKLEELKKQPEIRHSFERRLAEYIGDIQRTAYLILKREHEIAFIGGLGIGKSTAICKLTGLEISNPEGGLSTPVLEAGAGGITICEVRLQTGPGYGLLIEPYSDDEIRAHVTDFAEHILRGKMVDPDEPGGGDDLFQGISKEIERAVRNMAALKISREKGPDGKTIRRDEAKELATKITSLREYAVEVMARMGLHRRDRREVWYDSSFGKPPLVWLRDTFEHVNNGRHPEFTLPKRIEVVVPQSLLGTTDCKVSLIDTKGIDRTTARADIEKHLDEPHTLALLCSGFNEAPGTAARLLLERAKEAGIRNLSLNAALLVLPRPNEALAIKDEAGIQVGTVEEGYELKGEQVTMALEPLGLQNLSVDFFNSFGDEPRRLQDSIAEHIRAIRENFRCHLRNVTGDAQTLILNHEKEQVQEVVRSAAGMLTTWIAQNNAVPPVTAQVQDSLMSELQSAYASTIRASVRREGEWYNLSYGYHLGYGSRRLAVLALEPLVNGFKKLTEVMEASPEYTEAKGLIQQARQVLATAFEELLRKIQIMGQTTFKDALKLDPSFWLDCEQQWGQGPGYKNRVANRNKDWFSAKPRQELEKELWDVVTREWGVALKRLASLFETDVSA
jgi:transcriptional regulator with XRE-family HTH domain